ALLNDFLKAKGYEVGQSLVDKNSYGVMKLLKSKKIILPSDVLAEWGNIYTNKMSDKVLPNETIIDVGMESVKTLEPYIKNAKVILWNGPLGKYGGRGD